MKNKKLFFLFSVCCLTIFSCKTNLVETNNLDIEEDANWKKEALHRIDSLRKRELTIIVKDKNGNSIPNAEVKINLDKHEFKFGAAIDKDVFNSPHTEKHKSLLKTYFNSSGFENALKPKRRFSETEAKAAQIIPWFLENDFYMRGHALVWENRKNMRPKEKKVMNLKGITNKKKEEKVIALLSQHFTHALKKWDVNCWDVLNEPIGNHQINDLADRNTFAYWFKLADSVRQRNNKPDVKLFINENRVISGTTPNTYSRPSEYKKIIQSILDEGAPLEGIGFQSRIKHQFVSPEQMLERLKSFEEFNLPLHATEFEIRDSDIRTYTIEERSGLIEQVMLIYTSHYLVDGIWHWTFYNNTRNSKPWALFNYDGTPTVSGEQWIKTMNTYFNSSYELKTNSNGEVNKRVFKGDYMLSVSYKNQFKYVKRTITENNTLTIILE
ncbi:endo-1,4-beta-xylanase [Winogradskyella sp.]|nr:endo-1,4-beta-xylanase [Winogradskyella sp.]